jgi:hypothetical protein
MNAQTTMTGTGNSAVQIIGNVIIDGESFPLIDGYNEIHGESVWLRDTHHFAYANMDYASRGWHFEPCKEWARKRYETESAIYWSSVNPWAS